jgi:hypothetical protein
VSWRGALWSMTEPVLPATSVPYEFPSSSLRPTAQRAVVVVVGKFRDLHQPLCCLPLRNTAISVVPSPPPPPLCTDLSMHCQDASKTVASFLQPLGLSAFHIHASHAIFQFLMYLPNLAVCLPLSQLLCVCMKFKCARRTIKMRKVSLRYAAAAP